MPRVMEITTPLGDDLLFHGMHAREEIGAGGARYMIASVATDPAGSYYELRGRKASDAANFGS